MELEYVYYYPLVACSNRVMAIYGFTQDEIKQIPAEASRNYLHNAALAKHFHIHKNFNEVDLSFAHLDKIDMAKGSIRNVTSLATNISLCNLTRTTIRDNKFNCAHFETCNMEYSLLTHNTFKDSALKDLVFDNALIRNTEFSHTVVNHVKLKGATLENLTFKSCAFSHTTWEDVNYNNVKFIQCEGLPHFDDLSEDMRKQITIE